MIWEFTKKFFWIWVRLGYALLCVLWSPFQPIWDDAMEFWFSVERELHALWYNLPPPND